MHVSLPFVGVGVGLAACCFQCAMAQDGSKNRTGSAVYADFKEPFRTQFTEAWTQEVASAESRLLQEKIRIRRLKGPARFEANKRYADEEKRIERLKQNDPAFIPKIHEPSKWRVGDYGQTDHSARVVQVIDERTMLAELGGEIWVMLSGFSTSGHTDDVRVRLRRPIMISGTVTYTTVLGGTRTVLKAEPLDWNMFK